MSRRLLTGYIFIILAVFVWSLGEIFLKLIQDYVGVFSYIFLRMLIGGTFLLGILAIKADFSGIGKMFKSNFPLIIITYFILVFSNLFFYFGITRTQANMGAVLCSTSPVWITIFAFFILREKNNLKIKTIGILIGVVGVIILLTELNLSGFISSEYLFGNLLALGAEITWSLYSVLGKKIQIKEINTPNLEIKFTAFSFLIGCLPIFIILIFSPEFSSLSFPKFTSFLNYPLEVWIILILLGVVFSGCAYILFFKGIKQVDTSKGASLIFLKPIISTVFAFIILYEPPTSFLIVASVLIVIAIYVINLNSKNEMNKSNLSH